MPLCGGGAQPVRNVLDQALAVPPGAREILFDTFDERRLRNVPISENSFTGMETRPKAICAVAMALGMTTPQHSLHIRCFNQLFRRE